jgi:adenylosuccinate synthase
MATAILGMQWGDEGKGKITHLLAKESDMVVRFNGGANAGHTVIDRGKKFGIHLLPAGVFYPASTSVLAAGMVIDLEVLREEYETITRHLGEKPEILISEHAHLVLPYHKLLEDLEGSVKRIGTTRRGIGPAYRDRAARIGIRAGDLLSPKQLRDRLAQRIELLKRMWPSSPQFDSISAIELSDRLLELAQPFLSSICDTALPIKEALQYDRRILFEGAQGALLDVNYGTYPYVTSSSTTFAGLGNAIGIPNPKIDKRIGVLKAYTTRVGEGPFPTQLSNDMEEKLQVRGEEFGVTTGRPRRCGWLDLPALRHATALNDPTGIAVTKLDVLSGMSEIKVCHAYQVGENFYDSFPSSAEELGLCRPIYETFSGWKDDISQIKDYEQLPRAARTYLKWISEAMGIPICLVSIGPHPEETIQTGFFDRA